MAAMGVCTAKSAGKWAADRGSASDIHSRWEFESRSVVKRAPAGEKKKSI